MAVRADQRIDVTTTWDQLTASRRAGLISASEVTINEIAHHVVPFGFGLNGRQHRVLRVIRMSITPGVNASATPGGAPVATAAA
jgi:hypothetical protein